MSSNSTNFNIENQVKEIKSRAYNNRRLFVNFLKSYIIQEPNITINNWIIKNFWELEKTYDTTDFYIYWLSGGSSWQYLRKTGGYYTEEEDMSVITGYYDINYLFTYKKKEIGDTNTPSENKVMNLHRILMNLQVLLQSIGIETEIISTNYTYDESTNSFNFNYKDRPFYKEPYFNLKLVIKKQLGGSRKPIPRKPIGRALIEMPKSFRDEFIRDIERNLVPISRLTLTSEQLQELLLLFNGKSLIEINIESYRELSKFTKQELDTFNTTYIIKNSITPSTSNDYINMDKALHRLNPLGMLTFSYLKMTNKEQEMGLNIDNYRQLLYFKQELDNDKLKIAKELQKVISNYDAIFKTTPSYNSFFKENMEKLVAKYEIPGYEVFMDFIEKWFMSLFRKSINAFIIEINQELFSKFGVKLFIAGGDAMRRYDNDISFTKDIDTKLYIGAVPIDTKKEIIRIIAHHTVKLRNYLQENYQSMLRIDNLESDGTIKTVSYKDGTIVFNYIDREKDVIVKYEINLTLDKKIEQQFRVREIKKSSSFPVNLYSIDFQTRITKNILNKSTEALESSEQKTITISLLDVVLQDEEFKAYYLTTVENIPVASLQFLLEDLRTTYTTDDRALARISSGKYKKDIERYKRLLELQQQSRERIDNEENKFREINNRKFEELRSSTNFNAFRDEIERSDLSEEMILMFYIFLYKIENKVAFNIFDVIITSKILLSFNRFKSNYKQLYELAFNISNFKINIYNENLNNYIRNYNSFVEQSSDEIAINYLDLFNYLITLDDNKVKHAIPFLNRLIKGEITKMKNAIKPASPKQVKKRKTSPSKKSPSIKRSKQAPKKESSSPSPKAPIAPVITSRGRISKPTRK